MKEFSLAWFGLVAAGAFLGVVAEQFFPEKVRAKIENREAK